tara:strand:- start:1474 stop:1893 length:420 start_codon:yes stop_codon:yes gene_type:complete
MMKAIQFRKLIREEVRNVLKEEAADIGSFPIDVQNFTKFTHEAAEEIRMDRSGFSKQEWAVASKVIKYLKSAKPPKTIDEYIIWHNRAKSITGGKPFGSGSGFESASSLIAQTLGDLKTSTIVDKWDNVILPYIDKKAA